VSHTRRVKGNSRRQPCLGCEPCKTQRYATEAGREMWSRHEQKYLMPSSISSVARCETKRVRDRQGCCSALSARSRLTVRSKIISPANNNVDWNCTPQDHDLLSVPKSCIPLIITWTGTVHRGITTYCQFQKSCAPLVV
jgi:hypothetical protein